MVITVDDLNAFTGVVGDTLAEAYIKSAQERVEKYLKYKLERNTYLTETTGHNRRYVRLQSYPVITLTSVKVNGVEISLADVKAEGPYLKYVDPLKKFPEDSLVVVDYVAGYTTASSSVSSDCPELIKTTILQIAALRQMESEQNVGVNSKSFGDSGTRVFLSTRKYDDFLANIAEYRLK